MTQLYGFYSRKAHLHFCKHQIGGGHAPALVYTTPDGREVVVTVVSDQQDIGATNYGWDDTVAIGPVVKFVGDAPAIREARTFAQPAS